MKRPSDTNDFYERLGLPKDSSDAIIEHAYRLLAKRYHPDANPDKKAAEEDFKAVSEAYESIKKIREYAKKAEKLKGYRETWEFYEQLEKDMLANRFPSYYEDISVIMRKVSKDKVERTPK